MKIKILHRTSYEYDGNVLDSYNESRLRPVTDSTQSCLDFQIDIHPRAQWREFRDFYDNRVQYFEIHELHGSLAVESRATVETLLNNPFDFSSPIPMSSLETLPLGESLHDFLVASKYVPLTPEVLRYAQELATQPVDLWQFVTSITQSVHQNFKYQPGSTDVNTSVIEVLAQRSGVCQDFAHVMIAVLRSLKIPCRYVSGYIYEVDTIAPGSKPAASHAWCEVYLPTVGWRGLDATNGLVVNDHYVKLAVGRDYEDVAPIKGAYLGASTRDLKVEVRMEKLTTAKSHD